MEAVVNLDQVTRIAVHRRSRPCCSRLFVGVAVPPWLVEDSAVAVLLVVAVFMAELDRHDKLTNLRPFEGLSGQGSWKQFLESCG